MWNTPHSKTGWNLGTEDESTEYFTLNGVTCYHDLLTDKYYAFLGITSDRKVEFETREALRKGVRKMITENTRKQLTDYRKHGKKLKYLINYLMGVVEDEDDFEEIIIREMQALAFNEDEIVECMEYNFGLDMSWNPMSVNYRKDENNG